MARLSQEEFMEHLNKIIGDRTDDEVLTFIEDAKDTISEDKEDWKGKYDKLVEEKNELDQTWRKRYRDRFFNNSDDNSQDDKHENNDKTNPARKKDDTDDEENAKLEQAEKIRLNDLFKEAEN